jgi:hypothetical protein
MMVLSTKKKIVMNSKKKFLKSYALLLDEGLFAHKNLIFMGKFNPYQRKEGV